MTEDLQKRFHRHSNGYEKTTNAYRPFILFYFEIHLTRSEARKREKYLKSGIGKEFLKKL